MITLKDYWFGRDVDYPPTDEMIEDASNLLEKIALLEEELDVVFTITSGYRPEALIESHAIPGCPHDAHSTCNGIDLHDPDLSISIRLTDDPQPLIDCGLFMENPASSKNHLHLQSCPPKSGRRIFIA